MSASTSYARAALDAECSILAGTVRGRNTQVNLSGFNMGQLVAGGHLDRSEVEHRLMSAAEACGTVQKHGRPATLASLRSGLDGGSRQPRDIPDGDSFRMKLDRAEFQRPKPKLSDVSLPDWTIPKENGRPKLSNIGKAEPYRFDDEVRRHRYQRGGEAIRFKVKKADGGWTDWYRVRRPSDGAIGWQPKKPPMYVPTPYLPDAVNPFNPERCGEVIVWAEGERDCDVLHRHGFHAFSFGSASDVPDMSDFLVGHNVVVAVDNDKAGRNSIPKKIKAVIAAGSASVRLVQFTEFQEGGDCADFFEAGGTAEEFLDRAERIDPVTWKAEDLVDNINEVQEERPRGSSAATTSHGANDNLVTEDEGAIRFAEAYAGKLRYCHDHGGWFEWNGAIWRKNGTGLAFHWARELARRMAEDEPDKVRATASKAAFAGAVERFARADPAFAVTAEVWDTDPMLLGTPGGTVDLCTGELRTARPEEGITRSTAVAPADVADCRLWRKFLSETFGGDEAVIAFAQRWAGYGLTGLIREHALVFGHGAGGNGKGVYVNTHVGIMDAYAVTAAVETFIASSTDRHSTELAMLRGARIVTASETEEGRQWAEARIKALTGGDRITARFMRMDNFTFLPTFKLFIVGNHKPGLRNVDDAMRRRFNLLPFLNKPLVKDLQLEATLRAEWPGILRWMIEGCLAWQREGLAPPESVRDATAAYFEEQNVFGEWLAETCVVDKGNPHRQATTQELFASWSAYAKAANEPAGTERSLSQRLEKEGFTRKEKVPNLVGGRSRGFAGIEVQVDAIHRRAAE